MKPSSILIIRFSSIGDIVLISPIIRCLKQQTGCDIHVLTKPQFRCLLEFNPYIDNIISLQPSFRRTVRELKNHRYDRIVDLHKNLRSWRVRWNLGIKSHTFPKWNLKKWVQVQLKWDVLPQNVHLVDRMFRAVEPLGVTDDGRGLDCFLPPEKEFHNAVKKKLIETGSIWKDGGAPFFAFAIGGAHATKQMPPELIAAVCNGVSYPVLLLGGPSDRERGKKVAETSNGAVYNLCGSLSLMESAALIRLAQVVLTHDTGMMHIAAAFGKKIVTIWGNTIPAFGMFPYFGAADNKAVSIERNDLSCRPCSKIGYDECPKGHFRCMNDHSPANIARKAQQLADSKNLNSGN